jgi:transposase
MVLDAARWHKSQSMPIPGNIRLLSLPPYSPELNPLENHLVEGLAHMEQDVQRIQSICNWDWIIQVTSNGN